MNSQQFNDTYFLGQYTYSRITFIRSFNVARNINTIGKRTLYYLFLFIHYSSKINNK